MRNSFIAAFFCAGALYHGQTVGDFKYVKIQTEDFKNNKYDLESLLAKTLEQKQFTVIHSTNDAIAQAAGPTNCDILTAEMKDTSNMFRNRLMISFKDCSNTVVGTYEGKSMIKEFAPGMQDALRIAMVKLPVSTPIMSTTAVIEKRAEPQKEKIPATKIENAVQAVAATEVTPKENTASAKTPVSSAQTTEKPVAAAQTYTNGTLTLNRIFLSTKSFILVSPSSSVPYATFTPTTRKDVFRVQLATGEATLGFIEGDNLVIEMLDGEGTVKREIFRLKN